MPNSDRPKGVLMITGSTLPRPTVTTQMFFPNEPLNEKDPLFQMLGEYKPGALGQVLPPAADMESDSILVNWDITIWAS